MDANACMNGSSLRSAGSRSAARSTSAPIEKATNESRCSRSRCPLPTMKPSTSCASRSAIVSIGTLTSCSLAHESRKAARGSCSCRYERISRTSYALPE